jgi:hypothetical protein
LAHQDVAGLDLLTGETLYSPALPGAVPAIAGTPTCFFVCHGIFSGLPESEGREIQLPYTDLDNNFPHLKSGVQLTVALFAPVFFPALFLENNNFLGLTLAQDLTDHPGSRHQGLTYLDGVAVRYQKHLIEEYFISPLSR